MHRRVCCSLINNHEPVEWPTIDTHPINEFRTPFLATMAFPTLSLWRIHKILSHATEPPTLSMRIQAIIDHPHITDWFFTTKLPDFVQHWLYESLHAEWHWYRLEYQARCSTYAHGCIKLKNHPGICTLVTKAAAAWVLLQNDNSEHARNSDLILGETAKTTVLQHATWLSQMNFGDYQIHILVLSPLIKLMIILRLLWPCEHNTPHTVQRCILLVKKRPTAGAQVSLWLSPSITTRINTHLWQLSDNTLMTKK